MDEMIKTYLLPLIKLYDSHKDEEYAEWSKKYLRNQFEFLGIRAPIRRKLTSQFIKDNGLPNKDRLQAVIYFLWDMPEREFQKGALDLLEKSKKTLGPEDIPWLSKLIVKKSWWDTVDELAPHPIGSIFLAHPEIISSYADKWIEDENIWLQRTAIIYQLFYKDKTDVERLYRYILRRADSNEFFVQKAIGWALRQYAKTNPDAVMSFVSTHSLKPLSRREALKHF